MYTVTKMPESYLAFTTSDMATSDRAFMQSECMEVGVDGNGWIHPFSEPIERKFDVEKLKGQRASGLILERIDGGFRVDFSLMPPSAWRRVLKPEPVHGVDWIPVVEFVVPGDPPAA